jgi:hypothetical protein
MKKTNYLLLIIFLLSQFCLSGQTNRPATNIGVIPSNGNSVCVPAYSCNLFYNNEFESITQQGLICGLNCWQVLSSSPDVIAAPDCILHYNPAVSGTWNNASNNNAVLGLWGEFGPNVNNDMEAVQTQLVSPVISGHTYKVELWVKILVAAPFFNSLSGNLEIALSNGYLPLISSYLPTATNITVLNLPTLLNISNNNVSNPWVKLTATFVAPATASNNFTHLILANARYRLNSTANLRDYILIDNVSLYEAIPPPVLAFSNISIPCGGNPIINNLNSYATLNGSAIPNTTTYSMICNTAPNALYINALGNYEFDATIAGVGTHTVTLNYIDCAGILYSVTNTITVPNINCCNTLINYLVPQSTTALLTVLASSNVNIANKFFDIGDNAKLNIDYAVTFTGCKFRMGKEAIISLNPTGTNNNIIFDKCEFFACGAFMWKGIGSDIETGVINTLTIKNKSKLEDAFKAINLTTVFTINVENSTFNKNYIGLGASNVYTGLTTMPITLKNNIFSSAASLNSPTNILKQVRLNTSSPFFTPARSYCGVYTTNNNINSTLKIGEITSPTTGNTFDNIDIGIYLDRTKAEIYNNTFNTNNGTGIRTSTLFGTTVNYGYNLIVGNLNTNAGNRFNNCKYGVELGNGYSNVGIEWNQFIGSPLNTNLIAINAPIDKMTTLNVNNNTSDYYNNFFQNSIPTLPATSSAGLILNVNTNTINHAINPIFVAQNGGSNTSAFVYNISSNTINTSSNGILTNNMAKCLKIENNNITILNTASGFSEAIAMTGGCNDAWAKNNTIKSDAATVNNVTNPDLFGIHVFGSANTQIQCNSMDKMGTCLAFEGPCLTGSNLVNANIMQSGVYGLRLMNNGRIGTQGNSTTKNENSWGAATGSFPGTTRFQTYVQSTAGVNNTATGSVLYLLSGSIPTDNGSLLSPTQQYTIGAAGGLRTATNNGATLSCGGGGGGGSLTAARIADVGTPIANNTASYANFTSDNTLRAKQQLYQMIEDVPSAKADATINTFYNAAKTACIGKLKQVSDEINAQNYSAAIALNNSISTACNTDASEKQYYQLYLKYITDAANFNNQDKADLVLLANRCPQKRGAVVYKARVLNDYITQMQNTYSDNCNSVTNAKVVSDFPFDGDDNAENKEQENNSSLTPESIIAISPNPNNGSFSIQFEKAIESTIFINIIDMKGLVLLNKKTELKGNSIHIDVSHLSNGIYYLKLSDNKGYDRKEKLVVFKNE